MKRADAADLVAHVAEHVFGGRGARAVKQDVALVDEARADEHFGDLADHAVAYGQDHDLGLEEKVGRRRRKRRDAGNRAGMPRRSRAPRPQAEHGHAAESHRAGERGRDRPGADHDRGGVARGHV